MNAIRVPSGDQSGWVSFDVNNVKCPVLILHGEDDSLAPVQLARHNHKLVPNAELRVLPGHGHMSILAEVVGDGQPGDREMEFGATPLQIAEIRRIGRWEVEVQELDACFYTFGICERVRDRCSHVRIAKLCDHRAIDVFNE